MKTFEPAEELHLNHEEVRWEFYTGRHFAVPELIAGADRFSETRLKLNALGGDFHWTLNHEVGILICIDWKTKEKERVLSILLEKVCRWHNRRVRRCYKQAVSGSLP